MEGMTTTEEQPGRQDALRFSFVACPNRRGRERLAFSARSRRFFGWERGALLTPSPRARVAGAGAVVMAAFGRPDAYSMVKPEAGTAAGWGTM